MTDEQVASCNQLSMKFSHQRSLGQFVKIDYYVTAKDHVLAFMYTKLIIHEINPLKAGQSAAQLWNDPDQAFTTVFTA